MEFDKRNFKYLDDLIHSGEKEIVLSSDIVLDDDEQSEYLNGIRLDVDHLVIDGGGHSVDGRLKARIFHSTANVSIKNIILKNALGAIYNFRGVLSISQSKLSGNVSKVVGAAIYNSWGEVNVDDVEFSDNASGCHAGAIFNVDGTVNISNSRLAGNSAENDGGAIYNGSRLNIKNSILSDNTAKRSGGAIYDNRGRIKICKSLIFRNSSHGRFGGGAIHKNRGQLNIEECRLCSNRADFDGGAIFSIDGELDIAKSEFLANESEGKGGAIYDWGDLRICDSDISDNASNDGGGIYTKNKQNLSLRMCRFEDNCPNDVVP